MGAKESNKMGIEIYLYGSLSFLRTWGWVKNIKVGEGQRVKEGDGYCEGHF